MLQPDDQLPTLRRRSIHIHLLHTLIIDYHRLEVCVDRRYNKLHF